MMEKNIKPIIHSAEDKVLNIDQKDIDQYLSEVKEAVEKDNYRLDRNARRQDNTNLFLDYVIDEAKAKDIILSLISMDFSEILQNEHKGYEHEKLYVFGKDVTLLERNGTEEKTVIIYYLDAVVGCIDFPQNRALSENVFAYDFDGRGYGYLQKLLSSLERVIRNTENVISEIRIGQSG